MFFEKDSMRKTGYNELCHSEIMKCNRVLMVSIETDFKVNVSVRLTSLTEKHKIELKIEKCPHNILVYHV